MLQNRIMTLATVTSLAFSAMATQAAVVPLYSTNFNRPTYADGALNVNTDTTTPGQDGWLNTSAAGTNNIAVVNSATNGVAALTTTGQDVRHTFTAIPTTSFPAGILLQADINVSAAQATGDYFIHLGDGGANNFYARTFAKSSGTGFSLAVNTSSGATPAPTYGATLSFGTVYTILVRYNFVVGATNDTVSLYVNPTTPDGSGDVPYVTGTTVGTDATTIGGVYLRQGTAGNAATLTVDNIAVSYVPEPTTLAALGGLATMAFRRRRA